MGDVWDFQWVLKQTQRGKTLSQWMDSKVCWDGSDMEGGWVLGPKDGCPGLPGPQGRVKSKPEELQEVESWTSLPSFSTQECEALWGPWQGLGCGGGRLVRVRVEVGARPRKLTGSAEWAEGEGTPPRAAAKT